MPPEPINLLPIERRRRGQLDYYLRLGVVASLLALSLVVVASVLLIPLYLFLANAASAKQAHLASIESTLSSGEAATFATRLAALTAETKTLTTLAHTPSASAVVRGALSVSRPGITLTGFSYTLATGKGAGTLAVTGVSASRNALRAYQLALIAAPGFTNADLPVSVYAKDSDIPFTLTLTLAAPAS